MLGGSALEVAIEAKDFVTTTGQVRPVLRAVRFVAHRGEMLALFGPSGVGKSTALRIILGLDTDFRGYVRCRERRIAAVFQEPRLVPWLNILDNLGLVLHRLRPGARSIHVAGPGRIGRRRASLSARALSRNGPACSAGQGALGRAGAACAG